MRFLFSFLSCVVLVLGYSTSTVRSAPPPSSSLSVVANDQKPLHENHTAFLPLNNLMIDWLRDGLDNNAAYYVVNGHQNANVLHRDHFIELQYIRNHLLGYVDAMSVTAFHRVVEYANSQDNVFYINAGLNLYKGTQGLLTWTQDPQIRAYMCSGFFTGPANMVVYQVVQGFLNNMIADPDASISAIGTSFWNALNLGNFQCP
ncbi:hypothetical protein FRB94_013008 [Tulasnella sp. JGI-2019a]|nr:hypothetical protein FRB93_008164 [Tulasnella sp. JGI-2019a]KAG8990940.1 hypothetical protein FRB94_013008 [Tulasnella sp. JGI-2019a]